MFPYLPFFSVWPYTPAIPAFYWNAKSQEEIIKHIACEIDHIGDTQLVWNVTKGEYTDSKTALRDLYRELAVYGARVTQVADINTGKLSEHRTDETSAIGNLTIFNDTTPRVTNPTTGDKYSPLS